MQSFAIQLTSEAPLYQPLIKPKTVSMVTYPLRMQDITFEGAKDITFEEAEEAWNRDIEKRQYLEKSKELKQNWHVSTFQYFSTIMGKISSLEISSAG